MKRFLLISHENAVAEYSIIIFLFSKKASFFTSESDLRRNNSMFRFLFCIFGQYLSTHGCAYLYKTISIGCSVTSFISGDVK